MVLFIKKSFNHTLKCQTVVLDNHLRDVYLLISVTSNIYLIFIFLIFHATLSLLLVDIQITGLIVQKAFFPADITRLFTEQVLNVTTLFITAIPCQN